MAATDKVELTVHERDPESLRDGLSTWLARELGADEPVEISELVLPEAGYSSVTVLFRADWTAAGAAHTRELVARLPPEDTSFPAFPGYDFRLQRDAIEAVRRVGVPAPEVVAFDESGTELGAPALVFARVAGEVPSDNPPYVFGGWLADATAEQQHRLVTTSLEVLAKVHTVDPSDVPGLRAGDSGQDALRRHFEAERDYYAWTRRDDGVRIPVLDRAFDWLEQHWPEDVGDAVLCWGDARIGNLAYTDFTPTGVFDWEMACAGPRELDLGWFVFLHRFFQDIAEVFELPGMPSFLHRDDVVAAYEAASGHRVRNLDWFLVYAALRDGIVMSRIKRRMIHFGQDQVPADPDDYVIHQASLHRLLDGTYDWGSASGAGS
jgi:aminoglycoside phosphotransferase (APT) family kinase protein